MQVSCSVTYNSFSLILALFCGAALKEFKSSYVGIQACTSSYEEKTNYILVGRYIISPLLQLKVYETEDDKL